MFTLLFSSLIFSAAAETYKPIFNHSRSYEPVAQSSEESGESRGSEVFNPQIKPKREPSRISLLAEGLALAIPEYFIGVGRHEGSHALAVMISGGEVLDMTLWPKHFNGHIRFGETTWRGNFTRNENLFINLAPKITDLALFTAYTAWFESSHYPKNKRIQVLILVVAAAVWVDFTKDLFVTHSDNDVMKSYALFGIDKAGERLPWQIMYGLASTAMGVELGRGIHKLFKKVSKSVRPKHSY